MLHGNSNKIKQILTWMLDVCLLVMGLIFVKGIITEYMDGKTTFHTDIKPLTNADLPTMTICFEHESYLEYPTDLTISVDYNSSLTIPLGLGNNSFDITAETFPHYSALVTELTVQNFKTWVRRYCYKINNLAGLNELQSDDDISTPYTYRVNFERRDAPEQAMVYFTTDANAYGAVTLRWFDGEVYPYVLKRDMFHSITIPKVVSFEYVRSICSEESFYQCLSSKLRLNNSCKDFEQACTHYSLPSQQPLVDFPACNTLNGSKCNLKKFLHIMKSEEDCKHDHKKTCHVQEYITGDAMTPYPIEDLNGFIFEYQLELPKSTRGRRASSPFKRVNKEDFIQTEFRLIGSLGGTLGLMIGFSFSKITDGIVDLFFWIFELVKSRKSVKKCDIEAIS